MPLGCRVGVSLPYICHTDVHARLVWKPCKHFSRSSSGPLVQPQGRYWMHEALLGSLKRLSIGSVNELVRIVLDKKEAIFCYWDPLPYCAYYHIQLPFGKVLRLVKRLPQDLVKQAWGLHIPVCRRVNTSHILSSLSVLLLNKDSAYTRESIAKKTIFTRITRDGVSNEFLTFAKPKWMILYNTLTMFR